MSLNETLRQELESLAEPAYRDFCARLLPPAAPILGVRLPTLRQMARQLAKKPAGHIQRYLQSAADDTLEEKMLQGFVIGYCQLPWKRRLDYIQKFLPKIDNWSLCDSFCASLKNTKKEQAAILPFLKECLAAPAPYSQRFAIVMMLDYYADPAFLPEILSLLEKHTSEEYYVQMAIAWAVSVFLIKEPALVKQWLLHCSLDDFTYNKALQKSIESRRVSAADKEWLRCHKRHLPTASSRGLPRAIK